MRAAARAQWATDRTAVVQQLNHDRQALHHAMQQRQSDVTGMRQQIRAHRIAGLTLLGEDRAQLRQTLAADQAAIAAKQRECIASIRDSAAHAQDKAELQVFTA